MFSLSKKIIPLFLFTEMIVFSFFTNFWNGLYIISLTVIIISGLITLWALILKREGSLIISAGIILTSAAFFYGFPFLGLATVMTVCTSISIALQFSRKEKAEKEAQIRSVHFENELLKKNINPHFLMNSLTSIIVWLRKDPVAAADLIEALADEFRIIMQISALKEIPVRQEIELCRSHLKIMSYRKGFDYNLITSGIDDKETIPPMVFHTIIENGLTHGYENKSNGNFNLEMKKFDNRFQYTIVNDGEFTESEGKKSSGFGMKYIKSRLEESYPGRWKVESDKSADGWKVIIEIRNK
jgi:LytS/YehU family sensor histidine kinase